MKLRNTCILACSILLLAGAVPHLTGPTDLLSSNALKHDMHFVLYQLSDLRKLYSDDEILKDRQKRSVCRLDSTLVSKWRQEVRVNEQSNLQGVLMSAGITNWNGGKQIRIISKNSIIQSAFPRPLGSKSAHDDDLAARRISPGDIIVICESDL